MSTVVATILPVYLTIGLGVLLRRLAIADDTWVGVLNRYGMYVGFPVLVFVNLTALDADVLRRQLPVYGVTAAVVGGVFATLVALTRRMRLERPWANTIVIGAFFGNVAYLGFPLVSTLAPGREQEIAVLIAIYVVTLFTAGIVLLERSRDDRVHGRPLVSTIAKNPFIIAIAAAILVDATGATLPAPIGKTLEMIKASASPVAVGHAASGPSSPTAGRAEAPEAEAARPAHRTLQAQAHPPPTAASRPSIPVSRMPDISSSQCGVRRVVGGGIYSPDFDSDQVKHFGKDNNPLPALNSAKVGAVERSAVREILLRDAKVFAPCANTSTESLEIFVGHASIFAG